MGTRQRPLWRLLALLFAVAIVAAACGDDDDDTAADDTTTTVEGEEPEGEVGASVDGVLKFGGVLPQTGDLSDFGPSMLAAAKLAVNDINAAGGVLGADVELVDGDSGTNPDIANQLAERFITSENVDAILGAAGSTVTLLGVLEPAVGAGRLVCSGSNSSPALTTADDDGLYFRTAPSDKFQSQLLADTIAADGHSTVAILNRADDYGQAFADLTAEEITAAGAEVVAEVAYDPAGTNFDADAEQIAAAGAEAVVVIAFPEEGASVVNALIEQGAGPDEVAHYYTDGLASDDLPESVSPDNPAIFDGTKGTRPGTGEEGATADFDARLESEGGTATTTFAANFYDCAIAIALGAEVAGTDDPQQIAGVMVDVTSGGTKCNTFEECKALLDDGEDIDYDGLTRFDFDDVGEPAEGAYDLWEFRGGDISVLQGGVVIRSEEE